MSVDTQIKFAEGLAEYEKIAGKISASEELDGLLVGNDEPIEPYNAFQTLPGFEAINGSENVSSTIERER